MRVLVRGLAVTAALAVAAALLAAAWGWTTLRASLPALDGEAPLAGLSAPVTVARDALGIPTVTGATRVDVARATGYLHAQDRFFQMDLARRRAAGELAALVGPAALAVDTGIRIHRFRDEAGRALALLDAGDRALLEAYTDGVNAGLAALGAPPFEYLVLRQDPAPWRAEDSLLVVLSMFITLQDDDGRYESTLAAMDDVLPPDVVAFLAPAGTSWDAPIAGPPFAQPPVPGPDVFDARLPAGFAAGPAATAPPPGAAVGSNNWAVAGALTADGAPLVANDMHLDLRVPNIWYRAVLEWPDASGPGATRRLMGLTLPGLPALVAGSNGFVAWGFTNANADTSDIVLLETDPSDPDRYRTPDGWQRITRHEETIGVAGGEPVRLAVPWTIWGPVLDPDHAGRRRAYRWVAHSAEQLAVSLRPIEDARNLTEAFEEANGIGAPAQNLVAADRDGHIGWTLYGSIPRRVGFDGSRPVSWADGAAGWDGWLDDASYPRVIDPDGGRVWTANGRVLGGADPGVLGAGNYEPGSRATIIRDRLVAQDRFTPREMLDLQLDVSATFLERWRALILDTLSPAVVAGRPARAAFRDVVERDWSGRADPESAGYRLTEAFRDAVAARVFGVALADVYRADPRFNYLAVRTYEGPLWALVSERPAHWLGPGANGWNELLEETVDLVAAELMRGREGTLAERTWAEEVTRPIAHPLSAALPLAGRWLDMPLEALPGSEYTPRQQRGGVGVSERMVVSPGREADGLLHMPTGQSGHPLSPFYANSHAAWARGEPTPFLPGPVEHRLRLAPPAFE